MEIANHADPLGRRREDGKGDACHAIEHHRMGAQLFVKMHMRSFAEQVEIEIGQDRREAVGILDLDLPFAVTRAQAIVARSIGQTTLEQTGIVDAWKIAFVAMLVDDGNAFGIRKEDANDARAIFYMRTEIADRTGTATLYAVTGFRGERAHCGAPSEPERRRQVPASGTRSQSGR